MLVRHLYFNQNSYLKTENLLFLHIRSSRSKSLEHQGSVCLFSQVLAHSHTRTLAHIYTYSHICILDCTHLYILEHMCTRLYICVL